ncbi:hypothetical protein PVK06_018114 [Gossypium arboreum]|uniref:Uncharacterized protein n=1 Tax=Gossypium arboreum TaxID=29729 RepID=A0ABR0Q4U8_GOSAR|nr:hypothetical protein PVK06_018114 [Gossypium arboreum]
MEDEAGSGGGLRDNKGVAYVMFSRPIEPTGLGKAEVRAIKIVVEMFMSIGWHEKVPLVIESSLSVVLEGLLDKSYRPWMLRNLFIGLGKAEVRAIKIVVEMFMSIGWHEKVPLVIESSSSVVLEGLLDRSYRPWMLRNLFIATGLGKAEVRAIKIVVEMFMSIGWHEKVPLVIESSLSVVLEGLLDKSYRPWMLRNLFIGLGKAEVRAIKIVVEMFMSIGWHEKVPLVIESSSSVVLEGLLDRSYRPWMLRNLFIATGLGKAEVRAIKIVVEMFMSIGWHEKVPLVIESSLSVVLEGLLDRSYRPWMLWNLFIGIGCDINLLLRAQFTIIQ